jgi:HEAT repeat protein
MWIIKHSSVNLPISLPILLSSNLDRKVLTSLLVALGQTGGMRPISPLIEALEDEDEGMREFAPDILEAVIGGI